MNAWKIHAPYKLKGDAANDEEYATLLAAAEACETTDGCVGFTRTEPLKFSLNTEVCETADTKLITIRMGFTVCM